MTVVEVTNLLKATAAPALLPGFTLVVDEGLPFTPAHGRVRMFVEPQGTHLAELSARQAAETLKVTFAVYVRENLGQGLATSQTSALADWRNGPFKIGAVIRFSGDLPDYLNGRAPSRTWIPGRDAAAYPGYFVACALVTLDLYTYAAVAA